MQSVRPTLKRRKSMEIRKKLLLFVMIVSVVTIPLKPLGATFSVQAQFPPVIVQPPHPVHPDFNGDRYADLAIGVRYEDVGGVADAGAVNVLYGSASSLTAVGDQVWTQDSPGVAGVADSGDRFGYPLAAR
jgi:hypothetical protein